MENIKEHENAPILSKYLLTHIHSQLQFCASGKKKGKLCISCRNTGAFFLVHTGLGTDLETWGDFPLTLAALKDPLFLNSDPLC